MISYLANRHQAQHTWDTERAWLHAKGYEPYHNGIDALAIEDFSCSDCGHDDVDYLGFTIAEVVIRSYGLCRLCEHWFEF